MNVSAPRETIRMVAAEMNRLSKGLIGQVNTPETLQRVTAAMQAAVAPLYPDSWKVEVLPVPGRPDMVEVSISPKVIEIQFTVAADGKIIKPRPKE